MNKLTLLVAAFIASFGLMVAPAAVSAQVEANPELCKGIGFASGDGAEGCDETGEAEDSVESIIIAIIDIFSIVVGAVSVIMIILGGLRYVTSAGDSANVQSAKNTILYAIVGLVIVIFAQTIVKFVVSEVTGGDDGGGGGGDL